MAYRKGAFAKTKISCISKNNITDIVIDKVNGTYSSMPAQQNYFFQMNNINAAPEAITVNDKPIQVSDNINDAAADSWNYDAARHLLTIKAGRNAGQELHINIKSGNNLQQ